MADHPTPLSESTMTLPSDSEQYSGNDDMYSPPSDTTSSPVVLYQPPTLWGLLRGAAINLLLPFVNGMMLGFGELFAHEAAFRLGWSNTKIFPVRRRTVGPGVEVRSAPSFKRRDSLSNLTSME